MIKVFNILKFQLGKKLVSSTFFFLVSPQIAQFTFGDEPVNAGDVALIQCSVTKGDFPLDITWMFEGRPIESDTRNVIVSDSGKRVKQLTIETVAARHAGEYTCVASNAAGSVSRTAVLEVNGIISLSLLIFLTRVTLSYPI